MVEAIMTSRRGGGHGREKKLEGEEKTNSQTREKW